MTMYTYMPERKIINTTGESIQLFQQMTKGKKTYLNLTSKYQSRCLHWQCLSQCCAKPMQRNSIPFRPLQTKSILMSPKEFSNTACYQQNPGNQDSSQILLQDLFNWPKGRLGYHWVHLKTKKAYILLSQMYSGHNCLVEEDNAGIESTSNELWAVKNSCTKQAPMSDIGIQELIMNSTLPKESLSKLILFHISPFNSAKYTQRGNQLGKNPRDINKLSKHGKSHDPTSPINHPQCFGYMFDIQSYV